MAKYTSDANLIRGAGKAYRDFSNVPGMYAGLDKVIEVGTEMYETAVEKAEEEKAKKEAIEKSWNESADKVLLNAGALGDTIYNSTTEDVKKLKELYLEGVNEKDDTKRMSALRGLQSHSTWVQDHKQTNLDYAEAKKNGELSSYYKDNEKGREEAHVIDQIMGQKYKKTSRADEGDDVVFHVTDLAGNEKLVSSKQYNDMVLPKNYTISDSLEKNLIEAKKSEILDENTVRQKIKKSLPNDERDFVAGMYDDVSGKNLIVMLETSTTLDAELLSAVDAKAWDANTDGRLDKDEKANFIDAVTNPDNEFFNLENSKQIMEDQLFNGIKNKHTNHWEKINSKLNKGKEEFGTDTKKYLERGGFGYANNESGGDPSHPDPNKRNSVMQIGYAKQMTHRNSLLNLDEIPGLHYTYKHNENDGWQAFYNNEFVKNVTGADIARFEGLLSPIDIRNGKSYAMFNVGTKTSKLSQEQKEKAPSVPGGVGLGAIESPSVNQVKVNLQNVLTPQFTTDFNVTPVYKSLYSLEQKGQVRRAVKNKIKITGPGGFEKIYDIGPNATSEIADQITTDLADYKKVVPSDLVVN